VKATGSSWIGGPSANVEAFTTTHWVTIRGELPDYPF
jgi:benzaldehyde dehydrogenase (NAD)